MFAKVTFYPSWFYRPAHQFKHSDITFIEECQNDQVYQFSYYGGLDDRHLMHVIINNWFIRSRASYLDERTPTYEPIVKEIFFSRGICLLMS